MLVKLTAEVDGRVVGTVENEVSGTLAEIEEQLRQMNDRVGRIVLEPAAQELAHHTPTPCCCGHSMKNCGWRTMAVLTTFGEIPVPRRRYHCRDCGRELYPADAHICCGHHKVTRPLAQRICQLATIEHFTHLPELVFDQHGIALSHELAWELVHDVGTAAEQRRLADAQPAIQQRQAPPGPDQVPERIYVSCDGIMYCTNLTGPHPENPAQKRLIWQPMKVGCVYWQDASEHWHKQIVWGRESPAEFGAALWRLACRCGYQGAAEKIFAADGGSWCWDIHARYFNDAHGILDWYHASEHVWAAARMVAPDNASDWAAAALGSLATSGVQLLDWLRPQAVGRRGKARTALDDLIAYVSGHSSAMNYSEYRRRKWQIGTGMMESTCKQLVGQRLKGPGMHWSEAGALAVTALRAIDLNGHWQSFWRSLALTV